MTWKYCVLILALLYCRVCDSSSKVTQECTCARLNFIPTNDKNCNKTCNPGMTSKEANGWILNFSCESPSYPVPYNPNANCLDHELMKLFSRSNRLEIPWRAIKQVAEHENFYFVFFTFDALSAPGHVKNIMYSSGKLKYHLPFVTDLAMVISNITPALETSVPINVTLSINQFEQDLTPENLLCVRLSAENCSKVWTSEGCEVYYTNNTHIGSTSPELSTFTVLKRIQSIENAAEILSSFPGKAPSSDEEDKTKAYAIITQYLTHLEDVAQMMAADAVTQGELKVVSDIQELTVQALPINSSLSGEATLSTVTTHVTIPWDTVRGNQTSGIACVATIVLKGTQSGMDADHLENKYKAKPRLVSDVLTISISGFKKGNLSTPVSLQFTQSESKHQTDVPICVYWASADNQSGWLSDGCTVQSSKGNQTVCSCNHLTSFAVLMAPTEIPVSHENILQKITYVGIAVSLFCLLLSLISFTLCRTSNNIRITLHTHLTLSLFLAELLFVIHIDQTTNAIACKIVAILLHYLFLACFAWMFLEGVQLYLMVVKVFHSRSLQRKYLYLIGYGFPLVIVVTTTAINIEAYGTKTYCWLTLSSGFIWAFLAPVCAIIGINTVFFIIIVRTLIGKFSMLSTDVPYLKKVRSFTCTAIAQLVLLGGTWIFGIFHFTGDTIFMSYIFTIFNSLQGLFIFILHCVLNKQVRNEILNTASKFTKDSSNWKSSNIRNGFSNTQRL